MTVLAKDGPTRRRSSSARLARRPSVDLRGFGTVVTRGPLIEALEESAGDLKRLGLAGTMNRVGFQAHDGLIFETLTGRGVLVAIRSEPLAAEALAILHSYGGGNAAIGAWTGRV
jgi:hypothetical protein